MARWRLKPHDEVSSYYLTVRRYQAEQKITVSQFSASPHGAGHYKTVTLDLADMFNFPDALNFLIANLEEWRTEIRRRKRGEHHGPTDGSIANVAK